MNDGIAKELASFSNVSVNEVVSGVLRLGKGALIAKMDIKQAYRNIPVHPTDRYLLGMRWESRIFKRCLLAYGLPHCYLSSGRRINMDNAGAGAVAGPLCG